jgi:hypothetical protein
MHVITACPRDFVLGELVHERLLHFRLQRRYSELLFFAADDSLFSFVLKSVADRSGRGVPIG